MSDKPPKSGVPETILDVATGVVSGDELRERRERRPTPERIGHLEDRVDGVVDSFGELKAEVAKELADVKTSVGKELGDVKVAMGSLVGEVKGLSRVVEDASKREHIKFTATVDVDKAKKISDVNVGEAEKLDVVAARKARRDFWLTIVGSVLAGGGLLKLLQSWGVL